MTGHSRACRARRGTSCPYRGRSPPPAGGRLSSSTAVPSRRPSPTQPPASSPPPNATAQAPLRRTPVSPADTAATAAQWEGSGRGVTGTKKGEGGACAATSCRPVVRSILEHARQSRGTATPRPPTPQRRHEAGSDVRAASADMDAIDAVSAAAVTGAAGKPSNITAATRGDKCGLGGAWWHCRWRGGRQEAASTVPQAAREATVRPSGTRPAPLLTEDVGAGGAHAPPSRRPDRGSGHNRHRPTQPAALRCSGPGPHATGSADRGSPTISQPPHRLVRCARSPCARGATPPCNVANAAAKCDECPSQSSSRLGGPVGWRRSNPAAGSRRDWQQASHVPRCDQARRAGHHWMNCETRADAPRERPSSNMGMGPFHEDLSCVFVPHTLAEVRSE